MEKEYDYDSLHLIPTPTPSPTPIPIVGWVLNHKFLSGLLVLLFIFLIMMIKINYPPELPGDYVTRLAKSLGNLQQMSSAPPPNLDTSQLPL